MEIITDTVTSGARMAGNHAATKLHKRSLSIPSRTLRSTAEHLPSVDRQRLRSEKYLALSIIIPFNFILMYMFTDFSRFYWYLLPLTTLRFCVDFVEISLIIVFYILRRFQPQPTAMIPATPESFVYLLCCYNETYEELMNSMNSLAEQKSLDGHKKAVIVVCDGRVSGRGTPGTHMKEEIIERPSSTLISGAYTSWDGAPMDAEIVQGEFRGLPIICITKHENRGKRDGILLVRSFLHKFNQRDSKPSLGMLSPTLFAELAGFLEKTSIQSVNYVVGMDADTRFDPECVVNLIQTVRQGDQIIGVTGDIQVDPRTLGRFSIAYLYQNAEYIIGQKRRRLRQSITSRRVTCLPGCCQLLRVTEKTCGDLILEKFGHYPKVTDGLFRTIRSMMSEDRDHICLVLSEYADVQTRVCFSARAYTSAPHTLSVFLSQRQRWTLGPLTSDTLLASRKSTGWMERVAATTSVVHWLVNPALFVSGFYRTIDPSTQLFLVFLGNYRTAWDFFVIITSSTSLFGLFQAILGWLLHVSVISRVNFLTQAYTLYNLDDFRWGQMRKATVVKGTKLSEKR